MAPWRAIFKAVKFPESASASRSLDPTIISVPALSGLLVGSQNAQNEGKLTELFSITNKPGQVSSMWEMIGSIAAANDADVLAGETPGRRNVPWTPPY